MFDPPYTSWMKYKPDLALDSSSIGHRVRTKKQKVGILAAEVENPTCVVSEATSPAVKAYWFHPVGPLSILGVEEAANWREKYHLSDDIAIRIPGPIDRVSDFEVDEVPVYEGFFESGFRDRVPSLVEKVSEALEISPDVPCVDSSLGKRTTEWVLKLPIERRQVPFLVSRVALERCNIWGSKGEEALAEAFELMSAKKTAPKRAAPSENDDEVQFIKSNKRQGMTASASSSKRRCKASGSTPKVSPSTSSDPATVLANLNTMVFPLTSVSLPEDSLAAIQSVQSDLLQSDKAALTSQLREEKDNVLAKEKEIKDLKLRVRNQDEAWMLAASENVSLGEQLERCEEEISTETSDVEKPMAVNGARMVTRWVPMREWLNHQTDSWDLEVALEQYKMRTIKEVLKLPIERRQVPLLVSREALERCRIWGRCFSSFLLLVNVEMSGSNGEEALAEYKGALEVISAKKAAPKRAAPSETEDEVQFVRSSQCQSTGPSSSSKKKPKASGSTLKAVPSFIAKDVVAKRLDHDPFVLSIRSSREIKSKKLDTEPMQSQLRGDFLLGRDKAE
ncbi:LOW QUALITY PROTEIN: hypothetical protein HID58_087177 [Brassica napus]|uniref:Uncharacterized protein n=1 Tax=Brassica napus TaxID=3708 RepID=A0ABQ7XSL6_BRANA|nr:LOW QUALITY PROTEIN: hypothetical protein HID58_087177 [Brassica napus]